MGFAPVLIVSFPVWWLASMLMGKRFKTVGEVMDWVVFGWLDK
jgi:hypothetical protein